MKSDLSTAANTVHKICGSCAEARGLKNVPLIEGTEISTMAELTTGLQIVIKW